MASDIRIGSLISSKARGAMVDASQDREWTTALDSLVSRVSSTNVRIATLQAEQAELLSQALGLARSRDEMRSSGAKRNTSNLGIREVSAELAAALRLSDRSVQLRLSDASIVVERFPRTFDAWRRGRIDSSHVAAIIDAGCVVGDDAALAEYEELIVAVAEVETSGRLRAIARSIAAQLAPEAVSERQRRAVDGRRVRLIDLDDGVARIIADLPAPLAYGIYDRLTQMARESQRADAVEAAKAKAGGRAGAGDFAIDGAGTDERAGAVAGACADLSADTVDGDDSAHVTCVTDVDSAPVTCTTDADSGEVRSIDAIRADTFADLLLGGAPSAHAGDLGAIKAEIQITIPALAAIGATSEPCELVGHGPIDRELALRLAGHTPRWTRVLTDPISGAVLAVDRYRPSKELMRHLRARDEHCRFPGCRRPARRCDADHTIDAALGGDTSECNLAHFCRRHHVLKHRTAWGVKQKPGGVIEWTSPTGREYVDPPPRTVRFVPTDWLEIATDKRIYEGSPPPF